ncbi:MAG: hypothetical protein Q8L34_04815, partial [Candidatus Woesearchaeota archaeon]|nr:hypothetical protein [Candidatus Woesearchaeota archaeon]
MNQIQIPKSRIDLEKLGLVHQNLLPVQGVLAERYRTVLKQVLGLDCPLDSFRVDKRGLSPELIDFFAQQKSIGFKHGENYLSLQTASRFMIVVSPDQRNAPLIAEQTSYDDDLIDAVYTQAKETIEDVTQSEALFGELQNGIKIFQSVDDLLHVNGVEVSLDTLEGTIQKVLVLKQLVEHLGDGMHALDETYLKRMQE